MLIFHVLCNSIFIKIGWTKDLLSPRNCMKLTVGGGRETLLESYLCFTVQKEKENSQKRLWQN